MIVWMAGVVQGQVTEFQVGIMTEAFKLLGEVIVW